jgi:hypothetical protein
MNRNQDILNELREISPVLAGISPVNVFTVPEGYFSQLAVDIFMKTEPVSENGTLLPHSKSPAFSVPEGYFDGLAGSIMNRIKTEDLSDAREEINILSPTLAGINREMPYQVPRSYFDKLTERILDQRQEAKVVQMSSARRSIMPRWMKMAAAACIAGLLFFGAYKIIPWGSGTTSPVTNELANLPTKEEVKNFDLEKELAKLSADDINNYLCETGAVACNEIQKDDELKKEVSEISDEELNEYLEGIN